MQKFPRTTLHENQTEVFAAADLAPVGVTYQGVLRHVIVNGRVFEPLDWMPYFSAEDLSQNASEVFPTADEGPVAIVVRRQHDLFVLLPVEYYRAHFLSETGKSDRGGTLASPVMPSDVISSASRMAELGRITLTAQERTEELGLGSLIHNERLVLLAVAWVIASSRGTIARSREIRAHPLTRSISTATLNRAIGGLIEKGFLSNAPGFRTSLYCLGPQLPGVTTGSGTVEDPA